MKIFGLFVCLCDCDGKGYYFDDVLCFIWYLDEVLLCYLELVLLWVLLEDCIKFVLVWLV